jgi:hypothetical protein
MMRKLVTIVLLILLLLPSEAQIQLVENAGPGPYDGVTNIMNLNGKIVTFGNNDQNWNKIFRRYDGPYDQPDTLLLPPIESSNFIFDFFTEPQQMFYSDNGHPQLNQINGDGQTKQFTFRTYYGNNYLINESFDSLYVVSRGQPYEQQFNSINSGAFHPQTQDLYFLVLRQTFDSTPDTYGILKRDKISGIESLVLDLKQFWASDYQLGAIREFALTPNHIVFHNSYPEDNNGFLANSFYAYNLSTQAFTLIAQNQPTHYGRYSAMVNGDYVYLISDDRRLFRFDDQTENIDQITGDNGSVGMNGDAKYLFPADSGGAVIWSFFNGQYGLFITRPGEVQPTFIYELDQYENDWVELTRFKDNWYAIIQNSNYTFDLVKFDNDFNATHILNSDHFGVEGIAYNIMSGKDKIYFEVRYDDVHEIAFSDGTQEGSDIILHDGYFFGTGAFDKVMVDSILYFASDEIFHGRELFWVSESDLVARAKPGFEPEELTIYPNPAESSATVQWPATEIYNQFNLYNSIGQMVWQFNINPSEHRYDMDLQSLEHGVYFIELIGDTVRRTRLLKE